MKKESDGQLEDIIYCNIPCNYDGTNPEQVKEVMEKCASAIRTYISECLPQEKCYFKRDFNSLKRYEEAKLREEGHNTCLKSVREALRLGE